MHRHQLGVASDESLPRTPDRYQSGYAVALHVSQNWYCRTPITSRVLNECVTSILRHWKWSRRPRPIITIDDHPRSNRSRSRTTTREPCVLLDDERADSRCRREKIVCDVIFSALACFLASKNGGHADGLPANEVPRAHDGYVRP